MSSSLSNSVPSGPTSTGYTPTLSTLTIGPSKSAPETNPEPSRKAQNDPPPSREDPESQKHANLLNYYFFFLALFAIGVAVAAYFLARRRKELKQVSRTSRESALARDLAGWTGRRLWIPGTQEQDNHRARNAVEGLDVNGDAPPPYISKEETIGLSDYNWNMPSIPLPTITRVGGGARKPPGYEDMPPTASTWTESLYPLSRPSTTATRGLESSRASMRH